MSQGSKGKLFIGAWDTNMTCLLELYGEALFFLGFFALPVIGLDGNISVYTYSNGIFLWEEEHCQFLCFYYEFQES